MDRARIEGEAAAVDAFLAQWYDPTDSIEAHTSGSTGAPKSIRLYKADMRVSAEATCAYFGINADSHLVLPLSVDYIAGKMMVVRALVSGARLTVVPPQRSIEALGAVEYPIDLVSIVPAQVPGLLALPRLEDVRNVIIGGAPMTQDQEQSLISRQISAYASYGMTETCSHVALRPVGNPVYEAMPGITFSTDHESCLIIEAPAFKAHRWVTNDVVTLVDDRHMIWRGRRDNIINTGGIKVNPEEIETLLRPYLPDLDYYISSRKSDIWGEEVILVIAHHGNPVEGVQGHLAEAAKYLPHHLLPKDVLYVKSHEYTPNGKLKRTCSAQVWGDRRS